MTDQQKKYEHIWLDGYDFNLGNYLRRGIKIWSKYPFGFLFHVVLTFVMIMVAAMIMGMVLVGTQSVIVAFILEIAIGVLAYALLAGAFKGAHEISRNGRSDFGVLFSGLNDFSQIALVVIVQMLLVGACALVAGLLFASDASDMPSMEDLMDPSNPYTSNPALLFMSLPSTFWWKMLAILGLYLFFYIVWQFSIPFVVIEKLKFWDALETSRKIITPRFFNFLLLTIVVGIGAFVVYLLSIFLGVSIVAATGGNSVIAIVAVVILIIGVLSSIVPIAFSINYAAFEDIVLNNSGNINDMIDSIGSDTEDESA